MCCEETKTVYNQIKQSYIQLVEEGYVMIYNDVVARHFKACLTCKGIKFKHDNGRLDFVERNRFELIQ